MKDYAEESLSRIQLDVQDGRNKEKSDSPVKYIANLENGQKSRVRILKSIKKIFLLF